MLTGGRTALLAVVGAIGVAFTGLGADSPAIQALGWAAVAGVGLSAMLRGPGLRVMGALGVVLMVAAAITAALAGGWAWLTWVFCLALGAAAVATFLRGPTWRARARSREKEPARDLWKQFDAGDDPTTGATSPDEV